MKSDFRKRLRAMLAEIPPDEARERSAAAVKQLVALPEFENAQVVMLFLSIAGEVDTAPLALRSWQKNKRVLAPKVSWEQRRMVAVEVRSLTSDLTVTDFGVREPAHGQPVPPAMIDLVIVPGLGFDRKGNRLGRGRGFYDRFLSNPEFKGVACALGFDEQVLDELPAGPLDRQVDMVVTDRQVLRFER